MGKEGSRQDSKVVGKGGKWKGRMGVEWKGKDGKRRLEAE